MFRILSIVFFMLVAPLPAMSEEALVIYTARKEELIKPALEAFTQQTGIKTTVLFDDAEKLITRLESEGKDTPADVLIPVDVANMQRAANKGLLKSVTSKVLSENIPAAYRDPNNRWFGLSKRARVIIYNREKVKPEQLTTYEDLADPKWKGQLLIRSSSHAYNQSLLAAMIASDGEAQTEHWIKGVMANLARPPQGGDRDQIKAVAAGEGTLALANSYYYARMLHSSVPEEKTAAEKTGIFFPNQYALAGTVSGTHVNLSGAGVVASSDLPDRAQQLIEFLSSTSAQQIFAESNQEYPVNPHTPLSPTLAAWGTFKEDTAALSRLAEYLPHALRLADRSGWK